MPAMYPQRTSRCFTRPVVCESARWSHRVRGFIGRVSYLDYIGKHKWEFEKDTKVTDLGSAESLNCLVQGCCISLDSTFGLPQLKQRTPQVRGRQRWYRSLNVYHSMGPTENDSVLVGVRFAIFPLIICTCATYIPPISHLQYKSLTTKKKCISSDLTSCSDCHNTPSGLRNWTWRTRLCWCRVVSCWPESLNSSCLSKMISTLKLNILPTRSPRGCSYLGSFRRLACAIRLKRRTWAFFARRAAFQVELPFKPVPRFQDSDVNIPVTKHDY